VDHLKLSWPGLGMECPFCSHSKCRACLEVSVNVLACCNCRTRAIRRLDFLKEVYRLRETWRDEAPELNRPGDGKVRAVSKAIRRWPVR
jgi:transcription elongation factor Elf1